MPLAKGEMSSLPVATEPIEAPSNMYTRPNPVRRRLMPALPLVLLAALLTWCLPCAADPVATRLPPSLPPLGDLDDPLAPFVPKVERTPEEADRLEALALFAAGRMLEQQQDMAGALRRYERAVRLDPQALPVYQSIVQLAFSSGRAAEGVRYAVKAAELSTPEPAMLERLAAHAAAQNDTALAIKLYRQTQDALRTKPNTPEYVLVCAALAELYLQDDQPQPAADAMVVVRDALADPEKFGLKGRAKRQLGGKDLAATQRRFGQTFLAAGRLAEARSAFDKANELSADAAQHGVDLAELDLREGQFQAGVAHLQAYFDAKQASRGTRPYELLDELLAKLQQPEQLLPRLNQLAEADPKNVVLSFYLAGKLAQAGETTRAAELYRASLTERPTTDAFQALGKLLREAGNASALFELMTQCAEKAGDLRPLSDEIEELAKNVDLAQAVLTVARREHETKQPDGLPLAGRVAAAQLAITAEQFDAAGEFYTLALSVAPAERLTEIYKDWGFGLMQAERFADAAAVYQLAIDKQALAGERPDFHFMLAGPLEMLGRTDEAIAAAREAIARTERQADKLGEMVYLIYPRLAWVNYHAKRYDAARAAYEDLIHKFDAVNTSEMARDAVRDARFALSNIAVQQNDYPPAEEWLEQVLDEYPDDIGAMNDLGYLWAEQNKQLHRALPMIEKAVAAQPDNRAYRDSLGWVYYQLGRHQDAVRELERAVASPDKPDPVLYDHMGDAYFKVQRLDDARQAWQRAVELFDEQGESQKRQAVVEKIQRLGAAAKPAVE